MHRYKVAIAIGVMFGCGMLLADAIPDWFRNCLNADDDIPINNLYTYGASPGVKMLTIQAMLLIMAASTVDHGIRYIIVPVFLLCALLKLAESAKTIPASRVAVTLLFATLTCDLLASTFAAGYRATTRGDEYMLPGFIKLFYRSVHSPRLLIPAIIGALLITAILSLLDLYRLSHLKRRTLLLSSSFMINWPLCTGAIMLVTAVIRGSSDMADLSAFCLGFNPYSPMHQYIGSVIWGLTALATARLHCSIEESPRQTNSDAPIAR
jgi:hypothetical protein